MQIYVGPYCRTKCSSGAVGSVDSQNIEYMEMRKAVIVELTEIGNENQN